MAITTRARVALFLALATLLVAGIAGARAVPAGAEGDGTGTSRPAGGGSDAVTGICAAPGTEPGGGDTAVADCDDTIDIPVVDPETCGEQVTGDGPDAAASDTPCPGDDRIAEPGGAQRIEPRPGMADVRPRPFDTAVVSDDGHSVLVSFWSGVEPCYVLDHVDVRYGDHAIAITLFEGHDASAGDVACIEIAVLKEVVVRLDEPAGDRRIVDGAA